MEVITKIKNNLLYFGGFLNRNSYAKNLAVFLFFFCVFSLIYMPLNRVVSADDHFFHFRFAEVIKNNGLLNSFSNLNAIYFSKIAQGGDYFVYYNFLFYIVLIPFTFIKPLFLGIKLYAIFAASLSFFVLFYAVKKMDIKYPFFLTVAVFALTSFAEVWRFLLSRPYTLAPALLLLLLLSLHKKKYFFVFILSFIYLFWHSATFYFPLLILLCYMVAEIFYELKPDFKKIYAVLGGMILSLVLLVSFSPGFFVYMHDIIFSIFKGTVLGESAKIVEGGEVFPVDFFDYLRSNVIIFMLFICTVIMESARYFKFRTLRITSEEYLLSKPIDIRVIQTALFFISIGLFFGVIAISRRFDDFLVFFVSFYLIIFFYFYLLNIFSKINKENKKEILAGSFVVIFFLFFSNFLAIHERISTGTNPNGFEKVGNWLRENNKEEKTIFNTEWSWFPQLYFFNPEGRYILGLEPRFLFDYNPSMYWLWINISKGVVCPIESCSAKDLLIKRDIRKSNFENSNIILNERKMLSEILKNVFKSAYIITSNSKDFNQLNVLLDSKQYFKKVFTDGDFIIYEVI